MASLDDQYDAALDLLRRVNPRNVADNLNTLCQQNQELAEELLSTVDQPLQVRTDPDTGKPFLCCDYNRDGDSFRSPHSNKFVPPIEDAFELPERLRKLEVTANDAFDSYRELYYEGGLASCYLWEQEDEEADKDSFSGIALFQKHQTQSRWDSVHVFEVTRTSSKSSQFNYRLTSTVMLDIGAKLTNMSGNLTRQAERTLPVAEVVDHVANVGTLVEEMENKLRSLLHEVYFGKTRDVIGDIRSVDNLDEIRAEELQKKAVIDSYAK